MKQTEQRFQVFIRIRPYTSKQNEEIACLEQAATKKTGGKLSLNAYSFLTKFHPQDIRSLMKIEGNCLQVVDNEYKSIDRRFKPYYFNQIFGMDSPSSRLFMHFEKNIQRLFEGFNFTIFTYGITGSGKTYTVFGNAKQDQGKGLCHHIYEYLLRRKKEIQTVTDNVVTLKYSFFEVYNENVRDLLSSDSSKSLNVIEDTKGNTVVNDLSEHSIVSLSEIYNLVNQGHLKRVLASTTNNLYSSRSHALQQLQVQVQNSNGYKNTAKLFIVDLAGSQKVQSSKNKCVIQGANINKSLLALGNCITLLASNKNHSHVPYRDSKLTRILKESLGGNANTLMITCISSNPFLIEETITTLNYASRASGIQKKITRNVVQLQTNSKQNAFLDYTPTKNKLPLSKESLHPSARKSPDLDMVLVSQILDEIRQNAVQRHQLQQMLKLCKNSPFSLEVEGAITVNQCHKNQLEGLLKSYLHKTQGPLQKPPCIASGYNTQKKSEKKCLKFERRPRVLSQTHINC